MNFELQDGVCIILQKEITKKKSTDCSISRKIDDSIISRDLSITCTNEQISPEFFFNYYVNKNSSKKISPKVNVKHCLLTRAANFLGNYVENVSREFESHLKSMYRHFRLDEELFLLTLIIFYRYMKATHRALKIKKDSELFYLLILCIILSFKALLDVPIDSGAIARSLSLDPQRIHHNESQILVALKFSLFFVLDDVVEMQSVFPLEGLGLLSYSSDAGSPRIKKEAEQIASAYKHWQQSFVSNHHSPPVVVVSPQTQLSSSAENCQSVVYGCKTMESKPVQHVNSNNVFIGFELSSLQFSYPSQVLTISSSLSPVKNLPNSVSPDEIRNNNNNNCCYYYQPSSVVVVQPGIAPLNFNSVDLQFQNQRKSPNPESVSPPKYDNNDINKNGKGVNYPIFLDPQIPYHLMPAHNWEHQVVVMPSYEHECEYVEYGGGGMPPSIGMNNVPKPQVFHTPFLKQSIVNTMGFEERQSNEIMAPALPPLVDTNPSENHSILRFSINAKPLIPRKIKINSNK